MRDCVATIMLGVSTMSVIGQSPNQQGLCQACLAISPVVELSSSGGSFVPSTIQSVLASNDGRYMVTHLYVGFTPVAIYDARGRFLELYGKRGSGPGEFRSAPVLSTGPESSIWAIEENRLTKLDSRLRHVATRRMEESFAGLRAFVVPPGLIVMNSRSPATQGGFFNAILMDSAGRLLRRLEQTNDEHAISVVAPAVDGGFWALTSNQLELRKYFPDGRVNTSWQIINDRFHPWRGKAQQQGQEGLDFPPRAQHSAILDLGNNLLVVLTLVAASDWAPGSMRLGQMDANKQFDTIIDLVDLTSSRTIASKRVPEALTVVNGRRDLAFSTKQDADGHVITSVVRVSARRPD